MGERAIIERGMETLEEIGKGESTTFVLPQELTSLVGRYGKALSGRRSGDGGARRQGVRRRHPEDARARRHRRDPRPDRGVRGDGRRGARKKEAEAVKAGGAGADIKSADEVIQEMDEEAVDEDVETERES